MKKRSTSTSKKRTISKPVQVKKLVDMLATPEDVDEFNQMIDQRKKRLENEAHTNNSGKF